jgi:hypothetical protein
MTKLINLPFQIEPLEQMQARFPEALEPIWDATDEAALELNRPGMHRAHVFDFQNGLRLLISRDVLDDIKPMIHVSASFEADSPFGKELEQHAMGLDFAHFLDLVTRNVSRFYYLLADSKNGWLKLIGISTAGIPHWTVEDVH